MNFRTGPYGRLFEGAYEVSPLINDDNLLSSRFMNVEKLKTLCFDLDLTLGDTINTVNNVMLYPDDDKYDTNAMYELMYVKFDLVRHW